MSDDLEREVRAALEAALWNSRPFNSAESYATAREGVAALVPVVVRLIEAHRAPLIAELADWSVHEGSWKARATKAEAERDTARAQVVGMDREIADIVNKWNQAEHERDEWKANAETLAGSHRFVEGLIARAEKAEANAEHWYKSMREAYEQVGVKRTERNAAEAERDEALDSLGCEQAQRRANLEQVEELKAAVVEARKAALLEAADALETNLIEDDPPGKWDEPFNNGVSWSADWLRARADAQDSS